MRKRFILVTSVIMVVLSLGACKSGGGSTETANEGLLSLPATVQVIQEEEVPLPPPEKQELEEEIPGDPPMGIGYIFWEFGDDFQKIIVSVNIPKIDKTRNFFLQFYQSFLGEDGFYFGIQNRADQGDFMLIFSRWFEDITPEQKMEYVRPNTVGGAGYYLGDNEGDFAQIRIEGFQLYEGRNYTFIVEPSPDDGPGWYQYSIRDDQGLETVVGSLKFKKGALISKEGVAWTELFGEELGTYSQLPHWEIEIQSIRGDLNFPVHAETAYNKSIPMQGIDYDPLTGVIRMWLDAKEGNNSSTAERLY